MDAYSLLFQAAHAGAYGMNNLPEPSAAQREAGDYAKGYASFQGIPVVIENPRGSTRQWADADGNSGENLMTAHYGYFEGITGADGDELDCYIGPAVESPMAYVINQSLGGAFDEHKVMLGYPDERTARAAYLSNYSAGWPGLDSCVPCTLNQLKTWMATGDLSQPITPDQLSKESKGMEKVLWDSADQPIGMTPAQVLYAIRADDGSDGLVFDAVTSADILADSDGRVVLDAMVIVMRVLERKMQILQKVMDRTGGDLTVSAMQITEPFKKNGSTNVAVIFELSDGQTLTIFFHNPDTTPQKILPNDDLVSWKWMLNKKDITIAVAPERGRDLNVRNVAARVMMLARKNSARFVSANGRRAAVMESINTLKSDFEAKTHALGNLQAEISELEVQVAQKPAKVEVPVDPAKPDTPEVSLAEQVQAAADGQAPIDYSSILTPAVLEHLRNSVVAAKAEGNDNTVIESGRILSLFIDTLTPEQFKSYDQDKAEAVLFGKLEEIEKELGLGADASASTPDEIDPTSPEGYAKVMADPELQLAYQDALDAYFGSRLVAVRNALRDIGWAGDGRMLSKQFGDDYQSVYGDPKNVGAGRNVVAVTWTIDNGRVLVPDEIELSAADMAAKIDAAAVPAAEPVAVVVEPAPPVVAVVDVNPPEPAVDLAPVVEPVAEPEPAANDDDAAAQALAADTAFLQSASDGAVDFYDAAVTDRLASLAAQYADAGDPFPALIAQAKTAAKNFFIAEFQKKVAA